MNECTYRFVGYAIEAEDEDEARERLAEMIAQEGFLAPIAAPLNGVYVVHLPEFGNGDENVAWLFVNEADADQFCDELNGDEGPVDGSAWVTYEPIAYDWEDADFQSYRRERLGIEA